MLMAQAVPHHAQNRIARIARKPRRFRDIRHFDRGKDFFNSLRVAPEPTAAPPENSFDHDRQSDDRDKENRPHNGTALAKVVDDEVATPTAHFRGGCRACCWSQCRRNSCSGSSCSHRRSADRKSTRLNSSHEWISYAVFCLKK